MDIPCTEPCAFQIEGACGLTEPTALTSGAVTASDCPYFTGKEKPAVLLV